MSNTSIHVATSVAALADRAARAAAEILNTLPGDRSLHLVLSGGSTPRLFHRALAGLPVPWERVHIWWGDERFVPPGDSRSNMLMAEETLLSRVPVPESQIHRYVTVGVTPEEAAYRMEAELRAFPGADSMFDLTILGLGEDGHTASLFPGTPSIEEAERWVLAVHAPEGVTPAERLTFTVRRLNRSRHILFLVAGAAKYTHLHAILDAPEQAVGVYPAARIRAHETVAWHVDRAAWEGRKED